MEPKVNDTQQVLENHLMSFGKGDIEGIMSDFATDAILITPEGLFKGKGEIRSVFEMLLKDLPPGSTINVTQQTIEDGLAYIIWQGESDKVKIPFATDTLLVQNGKIVKQTFAASISSKD